MPTEQCTNYFNTPFMNKLAWDKILLVLYADNLLSVVDLVNAVKELNIYMRRNFRQIETFKTQTRGRQEKGWNCAKTNVCTLCTRFQSQHGNIW